MKPLGTQRLSERKDDGCMPSVKYGFARLKKSYSATLHSKTFPGFLLRFAQSFVFLFDVISDVYIAIELWSDANAPDATKILPIVFLVTPYLITLILLTNSFIQWRLSESRNEDEPESICCAMLLLPLYFVFGFMLMPIVDLGQAIMYPCIRNAVYSKWTKLYQMTRVITEVFFEAVPQVIFQIWIFRNIERLSITETLLALSITSSTIQAARALFLSRKFIRYQRFRVEIRAEMVGLYEDTAPAISVYGNYLVEADLPYLYDALSTNNSVKSLKISECGLGDKLSCVADAIADNEHIQVASLILHADNIGDEGAKALAKMLETNETLRSLILHDNEIGDEGATALYDALKDRSVKGFQLVLQDNDISDEVMSTIDKMLKKGGGDLAKVLRDKNKWRPSITESDVKHDHPV